MSAFDPAFRFTNYVSSRNDIACRAQLGQALVTQWRAFMALTSSVGRILVSVGAMAGMAALIVGRSDAQEQHDHQSLGKVDFPVSCSAPAQTTFNRAMALLHHMTYPQA